LRAKRRVAHAKKLLKEVGLEEERLEMFNMGASDAPKFAAACNEMAERVHRLGPNPLRKEKQA
jgi:F420-non-reducing hydrogenase iron-sulfur subunit